MTARPLLLLPLAALLAACGPTPESESPDFGPSLPVTSGLVERVEQIVTRDVSGTVRPVNRATLVARLTGQVETLSASLGDRVASGALLLTLSAPEIDARLEQAQATLAQVDRELALERRLLAGQATAEENVRLLEDRRRAAAAGVDEAEALASYARIAAPFAGVITRRTIEVGDVVLPGTALIEIEGESQFWADLDVPESLPIIAPGSKVPLRIGDSVVDGTLYEMSPAADPDSRARLARVNLPANTDAQSGQFIHALWPDRPETHLLVPGQAVTRNGQMERVFVVEDGQARLRLIRTGQTTSEGRTQILSGLDEGETVIVDPPASLRDGQPVTLAP